MLDALDRCLSSHKTETTPSVWHEILWANYNYIKEKERPTFSIGITACCGIKSLVCLFHMQDSTPSLYPQTSPCDRESINTRVVCTASYAKLLITTDICTAGTGHVLCECSLHVGQLTWAASWLCRDLHRCPLHQYLQYVCLPLPLLILCSIKANFVLCTHIAA